MCYRVFRDGKERKEWQKRTVLTSAVFGEGFNFGGVLSRAPQQLSPLRYRKYFAQVAQPDHGQVDQIAVATVLLSSCFILLLV